MALDPVKNFVKCVVNNIYNESDTTIVLQEGDGAKFPQPSVDGAFNLVWWNYTDYPNPTNDPNVEIVRVTGISGDTLTIVRGQEGTIASTKNSTLKMYLIILGVTKKMVDDIDTSLDAVLVEHNSNGTHKLDTDGTLTANSDTKIPSQKAVKTYTDTRFNNNSVFFQGELGTELTGRKSMITNNVWQITNDGYALLPTKTGWYHVHAQQLISTGASAIYLFLRLNGATYKWGYSTSYIATKDVSVDAIVYMNGTTNYVDFVIENTASAVWSGGHSSVTMFKICD